MAPFGSAGSVNLGYAQSELKLNSTPGLVYGAEIQLNIYIESMLTRIDIDHHQTHEPVILDCPKRQNAVPYTLDAI